MRKRTLSRLLYSHRTNGSHVFKRHRGAVLTLLICSIGLLPSYSFTQPLADGKDKFLGNCLGNTIYSNFDDYWNQVTPGDAGKWGSVEYAQDSYNWTQLDNIYNYAMSNEFLYKHHTLVWGNQQPSWIASLDSASQRAEVEEWIRLVGERYPDMDFIDVVNEPFNGSPPYMNALGGNGATGWDWVITAFQWARQYCAPGVQLILNEYNILQDNTVTDTYIALIDTLRVRGLIDAIGVQGHYFEFKSYAGASSTYEYPISTLEYNLNRLVATGLPVYITEFDINEADDDIQLENYKTYFPLFWENPGVKGITLWGYVQWDVWKQNAYLITDRHEERPALQWLRTYLASPMSPMPISPNSAGGVPRDPTVVWYSSVSATSYNLQLATSSVFATGTIVVDTTVADTLLQVGPLNANRRYYWRVSATNDAGTSDYSTMATFMTGQYFTSVEEREAVPTSFALYQNYPSPFNPTTTIAFSLPHKNHIRLVLVNVLGKEVMKIAESDFEAGIHQVQLDASSLASGLYFYKMEAGKFCKVMKMIISK